MREKIYQAFLLFKKSAHRAFFNSGCSTKESILYALTLYYKRYLFAIVTSCVQHKKGGNMVVVMCVAHACSTFSFTLERGCKVFHPKKRGSGLVLALVLFFL